MNLTIETLFNSSAIIKSVIDRSMVTHQDEIFWKKRFDFEETKSRTFKTFVGTVMGVTPGTILDRNANKPVRERKTLGSGFGEVASLGDRYQLDNDRLDMIKELVDRFNVAKTADQQSSLNAIIDYIVDDVRQARLAPHKRMDLVTGSLLSTGKGSIESKTKEGEFVLDIDLPANYITPDAEQKKKFLTYLQGLVTSLKPAMGAIQSMEMRQSTFNKHILGSEELKSTYTAKFGKDEMMMSGGLMTVDMVNALFGGLGLPPIVINDDMVANNKGGADYCFEDDRITLSVSDKLGKMRWHSPYEVSDKIPGKSYTILEGGQFISAIRTDEGRFLEYGCEWVPDLANPNKLTILQLA